MTAGLHSSQEEKTTTPMMVQWHACKKKGGDAVLLFRMGDFYEAFYEDAALLSQELGLTLTQRQGIPMSGIPFHTSDGYIDKLVAKGYRVAVAEQIEDPKKAKGIVKRDIVRIVTPGTIIDSSFLPEKSNNYFASIAYIGKNWGLAFVDLSTSEFWVTECTEEKELFNEIYRLQPSEFLVSEDFKKKRGSFFEEIRQTYSCIVNTEADWHFEYHSCTHFLTEHFQVKHLEGFGLSGMSVIQAAGALLRYIHTVLCLPIHQIQEIRPYSTSLYMTLDRITQRNLELTVSLQDKTKNHTLLHIIDETVTSMGGRLMHHWIKQPLLSIEHILQRQEAIASFLHRDDLLRQFREKLGVVKDIERLMMKISSGYATPRDLVALRYSFSPIASLQELLRHLPSHWMQKECQKLDSLPEMTGLIAQALVDEPPLRIGEGKVIREGYREELDELRQMSQNSKTWMSRYQAQLREETGIKTLKVGFTNMFGYYIEVTRGQTMKMPDTFIRRQTLVNAERYISPVLKEYEHKILTAEERIQAIENEIFHELRFQIAKYANQVITVAQTIAQLDCLSSLAEVAKQNQYCCPQFNQKNAISIIGGRHPIIEQTCKQEKFIPNDTQIDDHQQLLLITGPNMAGKSTYLRQVALIVIMAHMGSYVPADTVELGIVDKVFTRIGASDDLSRGHSTFMVEMTETANILHNVTPRSLVILDEIGRGTSTYDGISIAWSVAEYLLTTEHRKAKTLFATHYWELTKLEEKIPGAVNYQVAIHEAEDQITFLRKIVKGGTDKSYGIHVARLAGLPPAVIQRSKEILEHLEANTNRRNAFEPEHPKRRTSLQKSKSSSPDTQLSFLN